MVSSSDKKRFGLLYLPPDSNKKYQGESAANTNTDADAEWDALSSCTHIALAAAAIDQDPSNYLIRATQGHSIPTVDSTLLLRPLGPAAGPDAPQLPSTVVHGTFHGAWPRILASGGLRPMSRNHVHFATGPELADIMPNGRMGTVVSNEDKRKTGVISGMRSDAQILIYVDIEKAIMAGCLFWMSENGVVLAEGVPAADGQGSVVPVQFFEVVVERQKKLGMLMENGKLVQDTPEWMLHAQTPKNSRRHYQGRSKGSQKG